MLSISNTSLNNTSIFRKINPTFKFIVFILSVLIFFIPAGFFGQIIIICLMLSCLIIAKLSKRTYINLFKTFIVMTCLFILINWITNKQPIAICLDGNYNFIGNFYNSNSMLINPHDYGYTSDKIFISNILGDGKIYSITEINTHAQWYVDNSINIVNKWINSIDQDKLKIIFDKMGGETDFNKCLLYVMNNPYTINGINYKLNIISNISNEMIYNGIVINPQAIIVYSTKWYSIGYMAFFRAINISLKVMLIISSSIILTSTTTPSELTNGIEKLFSPLKIIKFPASECALILSIGIRFIPSLLIESKRILAAQASRGLDLYNGNLWIKLKSIIALIIPLFTISINRSFELANAMEARGYNPRSKRTKYRIFHTHFIDIIYLSSFIFIGSLMMFLWLYKIVLLPFGIVECGLIL